MALRHRRRAFVNGAYGLRRSASIAYRNMNDYDDLDTYNGDPVHDGWVDFDYIENTGELSSLFEDSDLDEYFDNLNDWD